MVNNRRKLDNRSFVGRFEDWGECEWGKWLGILGGDKIEVGAEVFHPSPLVKKEKKGKRDSLVCVEG